MSPPSVLLTGASGFIGAAVRRELLRRNVRPLASLLALVLWLPLPGYPGVWWSPTPPASVVGGTAFCPGPTDDPGTCLVYADGAGPVTVDGEALRYATWLPKVNR